MLPPLVALRIGRRDRACMLWACKVPIVWDDGVTVPRRKEVPFGDVAVETGISRIGQYAKGGVQLRTNAYVLAARNQSSNISSLTPFTS